MQMEQVLRNTKKIFFPIYIEFVNIYLRIWFLEKCFWQYFLIVNVYHKKKKIFLYKYLSKLSKIIALLLFSPKIKHKVGILSIEGLYHYVLRLHVLWTKNIWEVFGPPKKDVKCWFVTYNPSFICNIKSFSYL